MVWPNSASITWLLLLMEVSLFSPLSRDDSAGSQTLSVPFWTILRFVRD
jgi:hypothetical protein